MHGTCSTSANSASISVGVRCFGSFCRMAITASETRMPAAGDAMGAGDEGVTITSRNELVEVKSRAGKRSSAAGRASERSSNGKAKATRRSALIELRFRGGAPHRRRCSNAAFIPSTGPPLPPRPPPPQSALMLARICRPQLALAAHLNLLRSSARFASSRDAKPRRAPSRSGTAAQHERKMCSIAAFSYI